MRARVTWIDSLKGIGIILVIVGHCSGHAKLLFRYIYSFHMPLFFFASGFLFDPERYSGFRQFFRKKAPGRIVPYLLFALLSYALVIYRTSLNTGLSVFSVFSVDGFRPNVIRSVIGLVQVDRSWLDGINNITLWFLPCLLLAESIYFIVQRTLTGPTASTALLPVLAGISFTAYLLSDGLTVRLPWALETAFASVLFYGIGARMRALNEKCEAVFRGRAIAKLGIFTLLLLLSVWSSLVSELGEGNVVLAYMGYVIAALAGIGVASCIAFFTDGFRLLHYFGKNSLLLLGLHLGLMRTSVQIINAVADLITQREIVVSEDVFAALIVVVTLAISIPIIALTNWIISHIMRRAAADGGSVRSAGRGGS